MQQLNYLDSQLFNEVTVNSFYNAIDWAREPGLSSKRKVKIGEDGSGHFFPLKFDKIDGEHRPISQEDWDRNTTSSPKAIYCHSHYCYLVDHFQFHSYPINEWCKIDIQIIKSILRNYYNDKPSERSENIDRYTTDPMRPWELDDCPDCGRPRSKKQGICHASCKI